MPANYRNLLNLEDAFRAIRELQEELDKITLKNWDFHQRRIVNAHPSVDDYDYVVRKELREFEGGGETTLVGGTTGIGGEYIRTFGYGIASNLVTGVDLLPPLIVTWPSTLLKIYAKCKVAPTGANAIADIKLSGTTILDSSKITIPAGSTSVITINTFVTSSFSETNVLTFDMNQVGSSVPGSTLVVTLRFRRNA